MIKVLPKIIQLEELFLLHEELTFSMLLTLTGLTRSNLSHLLQALCEEKIVVRVQHGIYRRGPWLIEICMCNNNPWAKLISIAERCVNNFVYETKTMGVISIRLHAQRLTIVKQMPDTGKQTGNGTPVPADWYHTANGRILMAYAPEKIIKMIVAQWGFPEKEVWNTAVSMPKLKKALAGIRSDEYVCMELPNKITALGIPIKDAARQYTLSMASAYSDPSNRWNKKKLLERMRFWGTGFEQEIKIAGIKMEDFENLQK